MASGNSLRVCYSLTVYYSAQQSHVESEFGKNQDRRTDTAPLHCICDRGCLRALVSLFCDLAEARLAHSGILCTHNKFHEAELIWCHACFGSTNKAKYSAPASSGPLFSQLQCEVKGVMGGRKEKEKGVRPGAPASMALLL